MFRSFLLAVVTGCLVPTGMPRGNSAPGPSVWFVDSLIKVFPGDVGGTHGLHTSEFRGARNQHLSVQLTLRSHTRLPALSVDVKPLAGSGHPTPAEWPDPVTTCHH